ncbi:MAG TPA: hypothetical protein VF799_05925 [Geobacteraceae bacterium]
MVLGFNHNILYKGEVFHVQTEDSGVTNPHIITLLYRGGTIVASKKTSYADIIKADNLEQVVEELMKDQHKEMLRRLKGGEFDDRAFGSAVEAASEAAGEERTTQAAPPSAVFELSEAAPELEAPKVAAASEISETDTAQESPETAESVKTPAAAAPEAARPQSLDEIILDYLVTGDHK